MQGFVQISSLVEVTRGVGGAARCWWLCLCYGFWCAQQLFSHTVPSSLGPLWVAYQVPVKFPWGVPVLHWPSLPLPMVTWSPGSVLIQRNAMQCISASVVPSKHSLSGPCSALAFRVLVQLHAIWYSSTSTHQITAAFLSSSCTGHLSCLSSNLHLIVLKMRISATPPCWRKWHLTLES
jgi:hypothetical protein